MGAKHGSLSERFWRYVDKSSLLPGPCWLWLGAKQKKTGHGLIGRRRGGRWVCDRAHRVSWEIAHGRPVPRGKSVLHSCDVPPCVNPWHFFLGTQTDNVADMVRKGRQVRSDHPSIAKLSWAKVRMLRKRYASGCVSQRALAKEFSVAQGHVNRIIKNKRWKEALSFPVQVM